MSDHLWDPSQESGGVPRDVRDLETALRPYAYRPDPARLRQRLPAPPPWYWRAAAVVALCAFAGAALWWSGVDASGWRIVAADGTVEVGNRRAASGPLRPGDRLRTGAQGRAQLDVANLGSVEVRPGSVVRLLRSGSREQRMALDRGSIRAVIMAPPRLFVVETPSAIATDLGCAYHLDVDEAGSGFLRVTVGWVSFEAQGRESFIPAGAASHTRRNLAPGTPFFTDATEALVQALGDVDFSPDPATRLSARRTVLREARPRDALTLWHLLSRGNDTERSLTYDRFAELVPPPAAVTRDGVLRLEPAMLDRLWDTLGFGPLSWWRKGPRFSN
jgi:hypothetical protein